MSANVPTDICFSLTGLMERGGRTGPHSDGWGIAFYEGRGFRAFRDSGASADSELARMFRHCSIKSHIVISHIRQANSGSVKLENTHPFERELWGRYWAFAHNGQLRGVRRLKPDFYRPVGGTDSERAFCWLLSVLRGRFPNPPTRPATFWRLLKSLSDELNAMGVSNYLMSDSRSLFCYCSTRLHWITRRAPFGPASLRDAEMEVDFAQETTPNDVVTVVATQPLTTNETWYALEPGELAVFVEGERVF